MTEIVYKPWENDSQHSVYDTANLRRVELFEQKIEGLQVKVKRTSEGKFIVKTRVPVPPKPVAKKKTKAAATKAKTTTTKRTRSTAKKVETESKAPAKAKTTTTSAKKKPARKTSRKRK
tara:strand:- start:131 stop:487 length:357 start_codon:yes stop_codon:yes gene_type:complete